MEPTITIEKSKLKQMVDDIYASFENKEEYHLFNDCLEENEITSKITISEVIPLIKKYENECCYLDGRWCVYELDALLQGKTLDEILTNRFQYYICDKCLLDFDSDDAL